MFRSNSESEAGPQKDGNHGTAGGEESDVEDGGAIIWSNSIAEVALPVDVAVIAVTEPTKQGEGLASFVMYRVVCTVGGSVSTVERRYSDFKRLRANLSEDFAGLAVPALPLSGPSLPAMSLSARFQPDFLESRRRGLEQFLNRVACHVDLGGSCRFMDFLIKSDDATDVADTSGKIKAIGQRLSLVWDDAKAMLQQQQWLLCAVGEQPELPESADDKAYEEAVTYVDALLARVKDIHLQTSSLVKREIEMASAQRELGSSLVQFAESEAVSGGAVVERGQAALAADESMVEHKSLDFIFAVEDYVLLVKAIKDALDMRPPRRKCLLRRLGELEAAQRTHAALTEVDPASAKVQKAFEAIAIAQQAADDAKAEFELVTERLEKEMQRFHVEKVTEFKSILSGFVSGQLSFCHRLGGTWNELVPMLDGMKSPAAADASKNESVQTNGVDSNAVPAVE